MHEDDAVQAVHAGLGFVEELTEMLLESHQLEEQSDRYVLTVPLAKVSISATLHSMLKFFVLAIISSVSTFYS